MVRTIQQFFISAGVMSATFFAYGDEGQPFSLSPCSDYHLEVEGQGLFISALEHLFHFPVVRHSLTDLVNQGHRVCATGIPLKVDIYKNYRYFAQIQVTSPEGLERNISVLYTSPSVQADHNTHEKPWTAFSYVEMKESLQKIAEGFQTKQSLENYDLQEPKNLLDVAKAQDWWSEEVAKTFQITPLLADEMTDEQYYIGGWMKKVDPNAPFYAQHSSPEMVVFRYTKSLKKLELTGIGSAFSDILTPAEELLLKATKEVAESDESEEKLFVDYGALPTAE